MNNKISINFCVQFLFMNNSCAAISEPSQALFAYFDNCSIINKVLHLLLCYDCAWLCNLDMHELN